MKNEKGRIGLIAIIWILLVVILTLLIVFIIYKTTSMEGENNMENGIETNNTQINNNTSGSQVIENPTELTGEFDLDFLKKENDIKNIIYSPLSIKYALKMLQDGANGNTLSQIEKITKNLGLTKYTNKEGVLSLANGIFIRDTYMPNVKESYKNTLIDKYNADIMQDEFKNASNMNLWIENKTLGIIKNMLKDDIVQDYNTKMLLINALAIDMEWKLKFEDEHTHGEPFYKADGTEMIATTMNKETSDETVLFHIGNDVTAVSMDLKEYEGTQMEFVAIMPNDDLKKYVEGISLEKISDVTKNLKPASETKAGIKIKIPKFSFDYDLKLKKDLKGLGIIDAFDENIANFSNMVDLNNTKGNLYVSDALHRADIKFSEEGIRAAAVTVFVMAEKSAFIMNEEKPIEVKFDKPFLFLIRDKKTKEIWFVGTMYEPNNWENDKTEYQQGY